MNPYVIPGLKGVKVPAKYFAMSYKIKSEDVMDAVCETYCVNIEQIRSKSRQRKIVEARHVISWVLVRKMGMTLAEVGKTFLGGRDHTTVINSLNRFNDIYDTEEEFKTKADELIEKLMTWKNEKELPIL
jgi:chromosomal replication initiator protein